MWKHEIISDGARCSRPLYAPSVEIIMSNLQNSMQFYFGDYENYGSAHKSFAGQKVEKMPLPYDCMLVTFYFTVDFKDERGVVTAYNAALCTNDADGNQYYSFFMKESNSRFWKIVPITIRLSDTEPMAHYSLLDDEMSFTDGDVETAYGLLQHVYTLIHVLAARNIVTKCKVPPEKLNKKRIKHHHEPYDKYYILEVFTGVPKEKFQGEVPWDYHSHENVAFHMCRGHFKTYTEDAPLFGKYAGTFWWQPQARGKKENGTIIKDYEVINEGK